MQLIIYNHSVSFMIECLHVALLIKESVFVKTEWYKGTRLLSSLPHRDVTNIFHSVFITMS